MNHDAFKEILHHALSSLVREKEAAFSGALLHEEKTKTIARKTRKGVNCDTLNFLLTLRRLDMKKFLTSAMILLSSTCFAHNANQEAWDDEVLKSILANENSACNAMTMKKSISILTKFTQQAKEYI